MVKYTKEQLIYFLRKLSEELGKTPTIKNLNLKHEYPSSTTYFKRFKSWNNALSKAGLKINSRGEYTKVGSILTTMSG